jgi:hypothetical protein
MYLLAAAALDPSEVTNADYLKFVLVMRYPAPEYRVNSRFPAGRETSPLF